MILIFTLDLYSYTNPPPTTTVTQEHLTTRFQLFLDPTSPKIELLPTSKGAATGGGGKGGGDVGKKDAGGGGGGGGGKGGGAKGKEGDAGKVKGELYVVKRGWLGGWSVKPAPKGDGLGVKVKKRVKMGIQGWVLGWSDQKDSPSAA